ncbi:MAG: hypothetical protein M1829_006337 [Trizodia sp. TS-e1964]|nr:MAG: hypothetical protein M1829_006337 [Trizodia sp. TS-e1964]
MPLSSADYQTVLLVWICTGLAVAIMLLRLGMRKFRSQVFEIGDYLTMFALFNLLGRSVLAHVCLVYGTNNVSADFRRTHQFTMEEIQNRELGSKLILVDRFFYDTYLWSQKAVILCLYQRLLKSLPRSKVILQIYWATFAASYTAVQISTFSECRPFSNYWTVLPDPGICCQAPVQLYVLDLMLIILPLPTLIKVQRPLLQKIQLCALFCIGLFLVAVTFVRLPLNASNNTSQVSRTTWGSIECLAAAIVANSPALYSLFRRRTSVSEASGSGTGSSGAASWKKFSSTASSGFKHVEEEPRGGIVVRNSIELSSVRGDLVAP